MKKLSNDKTYFSLLSLFFLSMLMFSMPSCAFSQSVVAKVNQYPVTSFDVDQRVRIAMIIENKKMSSKDALEDVIDDQVKLIEVQRIGYRITDDGVDDEFTKMAKSNNLTEQEFSKKLQKIGIEPSSLRSKIRANLAWGVLLKSQQRNVAPIAKSEIDNVIAERKVKDSKASEYQLRQVIFLVAQGDDISAKMDLANSERKDFSSCESGIKKMQKVQDVVVKSVFSRDSDSLPPELLKLLEETPVGTLTPPHVGSEGVEMIAVCAKKRKIQQDNYPENVAAELMEKRVVAGGKDYLANLRKNVSIKYQ